MAFSIDGTRTKLTGTTTITTNFGVATVTDSDSLDEVYVPIKIAELDPPAFNITSTLTAGSASVTGSTGAFTSVKEGDEITSVSGLGTVTLGTPSTYTIASCNTTNGSAVITTASSISNLKVGDGVTGTGIGASAVVKSIDSSTQFTLSVNSTATGSVTVTIAPPLRVASKVSNTNIVLTTACGGSGTATSAVLSVNPYKFDATVYILRIKHERVQNNLKVTLYKHEFDGTKAYDGNNDGKDGVTIADASSTSVGTFNIDVDKYLTNARVPRTD